MFSVYNLGRSGCRREPYSNGRNWLTLLVDLMKYYCCKEFHTMDTRAVLSNLISWTNENNEIFIATTVKTFSKSYSQRQNVWKPALPFPRMNWGNQKNYFQIQSAVNFGWKAAGTFEMDFLGKETVNIARMWSNSNPFILVIMKRSNRPWRPLTIKRKCKM